MVDNYDQFGGTDLLNSLTNGPEVDDVIFLLILFSLSSGLPTGVECHSNESNALQKRQKIFIGNTYFHYDS